MTVYEPGGECLTKTQYDQREFRKKLQDRNNPDAAKNTAPGTATPASDLITPQAVKPVEKTDASTTTADALSDHAVDVVT